MNVPKTSRENSKKKNENDTEPSKQNPPNTTIIPHNKAGTLF
jgi:hypothetical protein